MLAFLEVPHVDARPAAHGEHPALHEREELPVGLSVDSKRSRGLACLCAIYSALEMKLVSVARETMTIVEQGGYQRASGGDVSIRPLVDAAVEGTVLYRPGALDAWQPAERRPGPVRIEVTAETTAEAGRRLAQQEGELRVGALNFASARNPGGGFLRGAKAQEEDLSRCSALYSCLLTQPAYYSANRSTDSLLYTDHVIYSPDVPFFRDDKLALLDAPFVLSIVTAPAPNAGEALRRGQGKRGALRAALERRAGIVLSVLGAHEHRCVVLGAWGCGVFRNEPAEVADVFASWLAHPRFSGVFDRVVFAIYDRNASKATLRAFEDRFGGSGEDAPA